MFLCSVAAVAAVAAVATIAAVAAVETFGKLRGYGTILSKITQVNTIFHNNLNKKHLLLSYVQ